MPFLLAEILDFQGSAHLIGVGSLSKKDIEKQNMLESKQEELTEKNRIIEALKAKIANGETERKLAVSEAVQKKEKEISERVTEIT